MIKPVEMFQTEDGRTHQTKGAALTHELSLEIRGLLQSKNPANKTGSYTAPEIGMLLAQCRSEFAALAKKYDKMINRHNGQLKKAAAKA